MFCLTSISCLIATAQTDPATNTDAAAKEADSAAVQLEKYVTTGTRFSGRTVTDSPVPIDVITSEELVAGGNTETSQMLQAAIPSFNFPRPSLTDGTDHIRPATLRGLAPDHALVLINGKRRHTSALVNLNGSVGRGSVSTDFSAIPSSAIGRIEVLRDGAAAQYGSDAIAGVVNVILKRDTRWGIDMSWGQTGEGDGQDLNVSASGGTKLGENGFLFVTAYGQDKEPTVRSGLDTRQQYFGTNPNTGAPTAISGNYGSGTGLTASSGTLDPREATFNRNNHRFGDARRRNQGMFFNFDYPLAGGRELYGFGGASRMHGESAGFFRRPGQDTNVRAIYPDGYLPLIQTEVADLSVGGGLKGGQASGWSWDLSTVFGSNAIDYSVANSVNVSLGTASPTSFYAGKLQFEQWTSRLDLTRELALGLAHPVKVALGAEYRAEAYKIGAGEPDSYRNGGVAILDGPSKGAASSIGAQVFPGFKPSDAGRHTRGALGLYLDLENNITDAWLVSAAARFEDYSDFGSSTTAKVATRLQLPARFALRGAASTGFRAPHLAQEWFSTTASIVTNGTVFETKTFQVSDPVAIALGSSPLKPETSVNIGGGVTWDPLPNFSASVDYYKIKIDDRIVLSSNFLGNPGSALYNYLQAQGLTGTTGGRYFTNAVDSKTHGLDLNARYTWKTRNLGKFTFTAGANFNKSEVTRIKATPPQLAALGITTKIFDTVERIRFERGQPKNNYNLGVNWSLGKWSFFVRNVRYGEYTTAPFTNMTPAQQAALLTSEYQVELLDTDPAGANKIVLQKFKPQWKTDVDVTYRWSKNLTLSAGVNNLFDARAGANIATRLVNGTVFSGADTTGILPYSSSSPIGRNGVTYFSKVSYKF